MISHEYYSLIKATSFLRRPLAVAKLALAFFIQAKLSHLQSFHQDRCCTHYAQTNCNDLHISCSWANASPQTKQTKRVSAREWMPALNPNKRNLYRQGRGWMPNKHPSVHSFLVETCDARILLWTVTQPVEWGSPSDPTNYHILLELYSSHVCRLPSVDRIRCHKPNISMTSANAAIWLVEILTDNIETGRSQIKSREIYWWYFVSRFGWQMMPGCSTMDKQWVCFRHKMWDSVLWWVTTPSS